MDLPTLDKCPGHNLYISGFIALRRPKALQNCRITHIVSVLEWQFEEDNPLTRGFQHLHIPVDDVEDENLLCWFPRSNDFIHKGLHHWKPAKSTNEDLKSSSGAQSADMDRGNGILIHCAMGKSRSATILLAYLLWQSRQPPRSTPSDPDADTVPLPSKPLSVVEALMLLRGGRPIAEPNEGFMDQLHLYVDMGCPTTLAEIESHKLYRRFMNKRNVAESLAINRAPDVVDILFEDENDSPAVAETAATRVAELRLSDQLKDQPMDEVAPGIYAPTGEPPASASPQQQTLVKCRRCRHTLASTPHLLPHTPSRSDPASQPCAHIFLHPLSWMKETLGDGQLEGRLSCPNKKCGVNVGKFAWQGLRCSCGGWVTPGFGVARSRVDEVKSVVGGKSGVTGSKEGTEEGSGGVAEGAGSGIRLPPGMRGKGHL